MPATSDAQRRAMAIAEHHPSELYGRNRGLLKMTHQQLHDFASTKETNLPHYVEPRHAKRRITGGGPNPAMVRRMEESSARRNFYGG